MSPDPAASRPARSLDEIQVGEVMSRGVLTCPLETPLTAVARMMAAKRVHSVVALADGDDDDGARVWGIVSDLDLVSAACGDLEGRTARGSATSDVVTVGPLDTVRRAAELMSGHRVSHVLVVAPGRGRPVGILSTLDVASVLSGVAHEQREVEDGTCVAGLMTTRVVTVTPETPLKHVARLLGEEGISGVPVVRDGEVLGVVSEADILRKEESHRPSSDGLVGWLFGDSAERVRAAIEARTAGEIMSAPAITIGPGASAAAAASLMLERGVKRLPVVSGGELLGIVTRTDLVRAFTRSDDEIEREIRQEVLVPALALSPERIAVEVRGGEVTLRGELESAILARTLPDQVSHVPGVVSVRSELVAAGEREPVGSD